MPRHPNYLPHGVIPAVLLPFNDDLSIDERVVPQPLCAMSHRPKDSRRSPSMRIRPRSPPARSTSSAACSTSRRTRSATGCRWCTASGRTAVSRPRASRKWPRRAAPPRCWCFRPRRSRWARTPRWRSRISGASPTPCDLPLIAFQYPLATGQGYPKDTLLRLCDEVPTLRAIKDWSNNVPQHEWHVRTLQSLPRPVTVLTHALRLADVLARARLQRTALRQRQRDPRPAGAAVPRRAGERSRRGAAAQRPHLSDWRACSMPIPPSTCTTA